MPAFIPTVLTIYIYIIAHTHHHTSQEKLIIIIIISLSLVQKYSRCLEKTDLKKLNENYIKFYDIPGNMFPISGLREAIVHVRSDSEEGKKLIIAPVMLLMMIVH